MITILHAARGIDPFSVTMNLNSVTAGATLFIEV
jgi:hypothetical protein